MGRTVEQFRSRQHVNSLERIGLWFDRVTNKSSSDIVKSLPTVLSETPPRGQTTANSETALGLVEFPDWKSNETRKDDMRKFVSYLFAPSIVLVSFCHALPMRAQSRDEQEIRAMEVRYVAAENAKDVDAIMKGYVPGNELFVFDLGLPRQHVGWDEYKKDWQAFFVVVQDPKLDIKDLSITIEGKITYSHMIQHVIWTNKDGSSTELKAGVTDVYRKINGKWLIVQEHSSVPIHIATGKAEMMSQP
jgi:ketosteroid isomerase-like protein